VWFQIVVGYSCLLCRYCEEYAISVIKVQIWNAVTRLFNATTQQTRLNIANRRSETKFAVISAGLACWQSVGVGRQLFYTAVHPRRQFSTSYSPPWELEISMICVRALDLKLLVKVARSTLNHYNFLLLPENIFTRLYIWRYSVMISIYVRGTKCYYTSK
jgi:hypothetical protein